MMIYQCKEWKLTSGLWYCEHTDSSPQGVQKWVVPARILGLSPAEFIGFLIKNFKPDRIHHNKDCSFVWWAWTSQSKMRLYKNFINQKAREQNFHI